MALTPAEVERPFTGDDERAEALSDLLASCHSITLLIDYANDPAKIPQQDRRRLAAGMDASDTVDARLARWVSVFDEEITAVLAARDRVVHGTRLSDTELKQARWLAEHLTRLLAFHEEDEDRD